ncbi:Fic family protein [Longimicrobium sp.]|uniref:Fic family protein n=1 Tax=Longimicrobium sp. TaxID=2029185 RepID=UPI002C56FF16|nr:Fic family protein [Longimicrobium sp.]HSU17928.1 Fic family protein [Longimicrobium sp.]
MVRNLPLASLPEVFVSTRELSSGVAEAVRAGAVRKLASRLYTTNLTDSPDAVVRRHLWQIVGLLFPDSVVSYRTALEAKPTPRGTIFLTGPYDRIVELPGLRVRQLKGPGPLDGDNRFVQTLWLASPARAFLECLRVRRVRGPESPALTRDEVEARLERMVRHGGEAEANAVRDRARAIAPALGAEAAADELDELIGALLRTRTANLASPAARARAAGEPYDSGRTELFRVLHSALLEWPVRARPDPVMSGTAFENLAFVDAYFSNFIEGTEFEIQEAVEIVFENRIPRARPEDAHDVLGTYRVVGSTREMTRSAVGEGADFDEFMAMLKQRHATIMGGRPEKRPGELKSTVNRAGLTVFVAPELVTGTLRQGWEMLRSLAEPFKRAAFMMFVVSEVHPFDDGNGRIARAMMNGELVAGGQRRIFIPTSYRDDYLLALRALSRQNVPDALLKMLDYAQAFSAAIDLADLQRALDVLRTCNAFERDTEARLRMPPPPGA